MPNFEETLARMKGLYTYGTELNENKNVNTHTLEYSAQAADGKTYGIIKECNKYYIKSAQKGKETLAESYEYLGGFCNKKNYEYSSYANALKHFELKMSSINEANDAKVNISTLDPFRANEVLIEGTDKMKDEIARQRQIMYNVSMLMNEGTEIGASRKDDVVMYDGKNPEAETGKKGDEEAKKATANPEYKGSKTNGVDKKVGPFNQNATASKDQLKENDENSGEKCEKFGCDWGSEGIGKGQDPKQVGWEIEGQKTVNEEENDWASQGLPSAPGVGEADTTKNNDPFNKTVNEGYCEEDDELSNNDSESDLNDTDNFEGDDSDVDDSEDDTDFDAGISDVDDIEGDDSASDEEFSEDDIDDSEFDTTDSEDVDNDDFSDDNDIMSQIESLQSQIDALRAKLEGGDESVEDFGSDDENSDDDFDSEDELGNEDGFDTEGELGDEDNFDAEDELGDEDSFGTEGELGDEDGFDTEGELGDEDGFNDESFDDVDECGGFENQMMESKNKKMNAIIESVVKSILSEDELHDFGKHPGYRKKPMELPSTGEDKNQWGRDWNDESVHNEEPFGSKIGSSAPFTQLVDAVTKEVMSQLAGEAFKGNKSESDN